jgi:hypothetical protein
MGLWWEREMVAIGGIMVKTKQTWPLTEDRRH